jgi:hypothetical protein
MIIPLRRSTFYVALLGCAHHHYVRAEDCQEVCTSLASCSKGSYCKDWQSPSVCFGLYYRDASQADVCYVIDDETCPHDYPVNCDAAKSITNPPTTIAVTATRTSSITVCPGSCQAACGTVPECLAAIESSHGSYCKLESLVPVCFGLYYRDSSRTSLCYHPGDASCPETDPFTCCSEVPIDTTTPTPEPTYTTEPITTVI